MSGNNVQCKSAASGSLPDSFPDGLRVLVVDDDQTCLMILEKMLKKCNYEAIMCNKAEVALSLLREKDNVCDIVLSDVYMPDMDGFKLLEHIGLEMDLPVIMMSADYNKHVMMEGVNHGACDYILKPISMEALRGIWLHVFRRKRKEKAFEPLTSADNVDQRQKVPEDVANLSSGNEGHNSKNAKRKEYEDGSEEREETSSSKKPRFVWSIELHQKFLAAVNKLGLDSKAFSTLKYRLYLKRLDESKDSSAIDTSFMETINRGHDLMALAGRGPHSGHYLTPLQTSVLDRLNNSRSSIPMPLVDQRNTFIFENPRFYGNATNMEPKQFMGLNQSNQYAFNGVNSQLLGPMAGQGQGPSTSQPIFPNGMLTQGIGSSISGSGIVPGYNFFNDANQVRPETGSANMTFSDWLAHSSTQTTRFPAPFAIDDGSGTHRNGTGENQEDLLSALLDQSHVGVGQPEDDLVFGGPYAFDDLPGAP
ncbi:putative response regulator and transcription factor RR-A-type family [Helianthus annuus]|nr:putative response regulator and transcription factor RR-A-type family [Helianthus annuus]KAJ0786864.1 putative response regulator and transcription factor RR-A-type family [Helianthus annuus]KAJ0952452.1 putative response regulator and transcription factor RR-A-type family [Helianthus annuus]